MATIDGFLAEDYMRETRVSPLPFALPVDEITTPTKIPSIFSGGDNSQAAQLIIAGLAAQGASGMITGTYQSNQANGEGGKGKEGEKKKRENAASDAAFLETFNATPLADIEPDPEMVQNAYNYAHTYFLPRMQKRIADSASIIADNETSVTQKEEAVIDVTKELVNKYLNDPTFLEKNPDFAGAPKEEQIAIAIEAGQKLLVDELKDKHNLTHEEATSIVDPIVKSIYANPVHNSTLKDYHESVYTRANNVAENFLIKKAASEQQSVAQTIMGMIPPGETQAQEITQEDIDRAVINFTHEYSDVNHMAVYVGTSLSEDGMSLINDGTSDPIYYFTNEDGSFYEIPLVYAIAQSPTHGIDLADQIEASGYQFDQISEEIRELLAADVGVTNMDEMLSFLRTTDNSFPIVSNLMGEETFVNTVGNYALETTIQAEIENGQLFANDPVLEGLLGTSIQDIITQQQNSINTLIAVRDGYESNLLDGNLDTWIAKHTITLIEDLDSQITEMQGELTTYQDAINTQQSFEAELARAENGENTPLTPDMLKELRAQSLEGVAAAEEEMLRDDTNTETSTSDAPAPEIDQVQLLIDNPTIKASIDDLFRNGTTMTEDSFLSWAKENGINIPAGQQSTTRFVDMTIERLAADNISRINPIAPRIDTAQAPETTRSANRAGPPFGPDTFNNVAAVTPNEPANVPSAPEVEVKPAQQEQVAALTVSTGMTGG